MSIKFMNWVWEHSSTSGSDRLVLLALADTANDHGVCWPSIDTLAKKANLGKRYVIKILKQLEEEGLIQVIHRKDGELNQTNLYQMWMTEEPPVVNRSSPGVVNHDSLGSEQEFTTPSEQGFTRVVNYSSPKPSVNHHVEPPKNQEEDTYATCPDLQALGVLTGVTGMLAFPGSLDDQSAAIGKIRAVMAGRNVPQTVEHLKPYYAEWRKRRYSKINLAWLDWSLAGEVPQPRASPAGASPPRIETEEEFQARKRRMQDKFAAAQAARKENPDAANPGKPAAQTAPPLHPGRS